MLAPDKGLAGCMIGRAAVENPWMVGRFDKEFYGTATPDFSRKDIILVPF